MGPPPFFYSSPARGGGPRPQGVVEGARGTGIRCRGPPPPASLVPLPVPGRTFGLRPAHREELGAAGLAERGGTLAGQILERRLDRVA